MEKRWINLAEILYKTDAREWILAVFKEVLAKVSLQAPDAYCSCWR
jgi:hypothetical protein